LKVRKVSSIYYPLTVSHPERVQKWIHKIDYRKAQVVTSGEVAAIRYRLTAPSPETVGHRIAFATDFHYRGTELDRRLAKAAARAIKEFKPDTLCLGGDLAADATDLDTLPELLKLLRDSAKCCLAIPGNWERGKTWLPTEFWQELYAKAGIHYLCNAGMENDKIYFYGCDELTNGEPKLPDHWSTGLPRILLIHRPDTVIALDLFYALESANLILCGHTHGGQVRFPFFGPVYASSKYGCALDYGLFERIGGSPQMIVSSGISSRSFNWRFNCRREVVFIEFA
jgi:predicted MPP superfamily phosphohydrolase